MAEPATLQVGVGRSVARTVSVVDGSGATADVPVRLADGSRVDDVPVPVTWAYTFVADDSIAAPAASAVMDGGAFVAELPGRYTILAISGATRAAGRSVRKRPRRG